MNRMPRVTAAALALLLAGTAAAQETTKGGPVSRPPNEPQSSTHNPAAQGHILGEVVVGERAPDFELDGSHGRPARLSSLRGDWVVLVFADRREQLARLAAIQGNMQEIGATLVGVCREKAYVLERYASREKVPFLMLADWSGEIAALYGLYDYERSEIQSGFLVLDRTGTVRSAFIGGNLPPDDMARIARFAVTGM